MTLSRGLSLDLYLLNTYHTVHRTVDRTACTKNCIVPSFIWGWKGTAYKTLCTDWVYIKRQDALYRTLSIRRHVGFRHCMETLSLWYYVHDAVRSRHKEHTFRLSSQRRVYWVYAEDSRRHAICITLWIQYCPYGTSIEQTVDRVILSQYYTVFEM